ncbi:MAG: hypothetical protein ACRENE_12150 [Polyangiaceae bacterium]
MTPARSAITALLALGLGALASPARAAAGADTPAPAGPAPVFVSIDFDAIPRGTLPPMPAGDAPPDTSRTEVEEGLSLQKVKQPPRHKKPHPMKRKMANGIAAKPLKTDVVEVMPDHPELGAMYVPDPQSSDFNGESVSPLTCKTDQAASPLRWETLAVEGDVANLDVKDLWFQSMACAVTAGATSRVSLGVVARDGDKPWLYAVRDDRTITFLFSRATDVTTDAAVGTPVTVRGGFTRVTLPLGRWGSTTFVAHLPSLAFETPAPAAPAVKPSRGQAVRPKPEPAPAADPVEIAVELVQTMSEASPTILVRRGTLDPGAVHEDARVRD